MNKRVLFLYGISHLQKFSKYKIDKNTEFIKLLKDRDVYFLTFVKKKMLKKFVNFDKFKEVIDGSELFKLNTLEEFFIGLDKLQDEYKFDKIYLNFMPLDMAFSRGNERKLLKLYVDSLNDKNIIKFNYIKSLYRRLLIPMHFMIKYKLFATHIIEDPISPDYPAFNPKYDEKYRIYFYEPNNLLANYWPLLEYGLNYMGDISKPKENDFVFGLTNIMNSFQNRDMIIGDLLYCEENNMFDGLNYKLFIKDKKREINTYCMPGEYNDHILNSKFTLVINSYAETDISMLRFGESLTRGCIPLIHKHENLLTIKNVIDNIGKFENSLFDVYEKHNLYIDDIKKLPELLKNINYDKVMNEIKNTTYFKNRRDEQFYQLSIDTLLSGDIL